MELERIASNLYRAFPRNAEKLSRELERMTGLLEETDRTSRGDRSCCDDGDREGEVPQGQGP